MEKKNYLGREDGISFIWKTASTGSSAIGALVAANSLQPMGSKIQLKKIGCILVKKVLKICS